MIFCILSGSSLLVIVLNSFPNFLHGTPAVKTLCYTALSPSTEQSEQVQDPQNSLEVATEHGFCLSCEGVTLSGQRSSPNTYHQRSPPTTPATSTSDQLPSSLISQCNPPNLVQGGGSPVELVMMMRALCLIRSHG